MNDTLKLILSIISIGGSVYALYRWVWKYIHNWVSRYRYYHSTGYYIVKDVEMHFGKEAGNVIKTLLSEKGYNILLTKKRLDLIENAMGIGIYLCDASGLCTYANKTLAHMFGLDPSEMLGSGWLTPVIDAQRTHYNWKFSVDNKIPYKDTYRIVVNDITKTCMTEALPSIEDDVIIGYVGFVKFEEVTTV